MDLVYYLGVSRRETPCPLLYVRGVGGLVIRLVLLGANR